MPEIPEYYRRVRLSAGGSIPRPPDTGAANRAIGQAGSVMTDFGLTVIENFLRAEAVDQFNNFKAETMAQMDDYERTLDPKQDTKDWEKGSNTLLTQQNQALSKLSNGEARRNAEPWLAAWGGEWKSRIYWSARRAKTDQMEASFKANINSYSKRAIEAADEKTYADSLAAIDEEIDSQTTIDSEGDIRLLSTAEAKLFKQEALEDIETKRPVWLHKTQYDAALRDAGMDPEGVIESANKLIASGKKSDLYPDLDAGDWRTIKNAAKATLTEREARTKLQSEQAEADLTARMAALDFAKPDSLGEVQALRREIAENELLDGTQIRELSHFLDSRITNAGKQATELEQLDATDAIYTAIEKGDRVEAKKLLRENAWMFTAAKNDSLLKEIVGRETKTTDTMLTDALAAEEAVADAEVAALAASDKTPDVVGKLRVESMRRKEVIRQQWREHPDMTPKEKADFTEGLLQEAKEEAAKTGIRNWMKKNWEWYRYGTEENLTLQGRLRKQREKANLPMVFSDADYEALPSGTEFIGPDGNKRKKP